MNYTWEITGIKRKNTEDLNNIIVQTYWRKTGTDENGNSASFAGATPFDLSTVDPENFISYEDLTEEIVLSWIKSVVVFDYEEHVNETIQRKIDEIVNPITEIEKEDLPWAK